MDPSKNEVQPPRPNSAERLGDVGNLLGLLLAGFAGALNLVGLSHAELTTILRNQGILVGFASFLLLGALISAISSIFVERGYRIHLWIAGAVVSGLLAIALFAVYAVRIPKTATWGRGWTLGCSLLLAALAAAGIAAWVIRRPARPAISLQFTLLIASAILFSSATTTAVRVEARNQAVATFPQLEVSTDLKGDIGEASATVSATKMRDYEHVTLEVYGAPRGSSAKERWPCPDKCKFIADIDINPDSFGNVEKKVFKIPFLRSRYKHLTVAAYICEAGQERKDCQFGEKNTAWDLAID
ncbi:hypothetical protein [Streptomyces cyanogenus]|uniref:Uncharacterized protein n=1 Tax=Streptomyces cyanogenus TaxID=80860 RepID=A0ABX7TP03_STRCY|nr:hypothetical protein [Streptomyces cyanogenus]QTD98136.1 hypothetical protein S1361_12315 [Streptomyces cyanogenus]